MHVHVVGKILPDFAERLKVEKVVSDYNRRPFMIRLFEEFPAIRILPDLVLVMPDGERVLVEVANPRDPKRFIGELVYPRLLSHCQLISAAVFFILSPSKQTQVDKRVLSQSWVAADIIKAKTVFIAYPWVESEDINFNNLKSFLKTTYSFLQR